VRRTALRRTKGLEPVSRKRRDDTPELRAWHDAVLARDGKCQLPVRYDGSVPVPMCQGRLEAHHVRGRAGKLLTDVGHGVTLCSGHHRFVHGWGLRKAREWGLM
jgi:hypothetical protein